MRKKIELAERYGKLTVFPQIKKGGAASLVLCLCDCGKECWSEPRCLVHRGRRSCGCDLSRKRRPDSEIAEKHELYRVWSAMRDRCNNPRNPHFANYGGRGIAVAKEWDSFWLFVEHMGPRPTGYTIERENNDGPYSPQNCGWASRAAQNRNKRNTILYTFNGYSGCIKDVAAHFGVDRQRLRYRLKRLEWPIEKSMNDLLKIKALGLGGATSRCPGWS